MSFSALVFTTLYPTKLVFSLPFSTILHLLPPRTRTPECATRLKLNYWHEIHSLRHCFTTVNAMYKDFYLWIFLLSHDSSPSIRASRRRKFPPTKSIVGGSVLLSAPFLTSPYRALHSPLHISEQNYARLHLTIRLWTWPLFGDYCSCTSNQASAG